MLITIIILLGLLIATYTDLRTREVPDWLNYSLIAAGLGINLINAVAFKDASIIAASITGFLVSALIGHVLFQTGQWGGGDSKMMMGLGALIGIPVMRQFPFFTGIPLLIKFYFNILIAGALYGFAWVIVLTVKHRKTVFSRCAKELEKHKKIKYIITAAVIMLIIATFLIIKDRFIMTTISLVWITLYLTFYLWIFVRAVEETAMIKDVSPKELTEGDWIVNDIIVKGKRICGPKDLGIEKPQIKELIRLKVKKVTIKNGIPFIPSFLLGYIATLIFKEMLLFNLI